MPHGDLCVKLLLLRITARSLKSVGLGMHYRLQNPTYEILARGWRYLRRRDWLWRITTKAPSNSEAIQRALVVTSVTVTSLHFLSADAEQSHRFHGPVKENKPVTRLNHEEGGLGRGMTCVALVTCFGLGRLTF